MKGGNLHTIMRASSLLRVALFRTHSIVINTMIFLMQKSDLEK